MARNIVKLINTRMRQYMKIINEASSPIDFDHDSDHANPQHIDWAGLLHHVLKNSPNRLVFDLVLSGIPFDDAVQHIAKRDGVDPLELRAKAMAAYKKMRATPESYDNPDNVMLIQHLNKVIREAVESLISKI